MSEPTPVPHTHAMPAGLVLHAPPPGLLSSERSWIEARAAQMGGYTPAFCHLVRLQIVCDAVDACSLALDKVKRRARRKGLSEAAIRRLLEQREQRRAAGYLGPRWHNLLAWRRPGEPGGHGDDAVDDPAWPLPPERVRRLIAEGREVCDAEKW